MSSTISLKPLMTLGAPSIGTHDWSLKLGSNEQLASFVICAKSTRFLWRDHAVAKQDEGHRNSLHAYAIVGQWLLRHPGEQRWLPDFRLSYWTLETLLQATAARLLGQYAKREDVEFL
ncbi:uncharacterized protein PGTG_07995 [Puccinia graminis f. sp. tritici CRL 75-36-700-3]|uniref:Uncharacterized protein n=1 Tax=Puccinia graminis f. sp. tritici (strain CRL 75-36-700-3 / race SCCL) TaxID=418459 RepID=E3KB20_PUCGT|nr:uncharacterized protein PGTG_07995 [Puccinia graminis f. sp. tritici CRL 75-36-700-3]EFP81746.1 hypothetical protein PGTG_07995 [Puccinia graminis f. sp. tritici CRL 75-36-700-3]